MLLLENMSNIMINNINKFLVNIIQKSLAFAGLFVLTLVFKCEVLLYINVFNCNV